MARIALHGALAGILALASDSKKVLAASAKDLSQIILVAGVGFEPTTFRL